MPNKKLEDPTNPISDEFMCDPYPSYDELRSNAPIFWSEKGKYWIVTSYDIANQITKDLRFGKRLERWNHLNPLAKVLPGPAKLIRSRKNWMLNANPPEHTHLRSLVNKAFTPKMIEQMRAHIQQIADRLIDGVLPAGKMEFIGQFAFPIPITVIAEMLGIPSADHSKFRELSNTLTQTLEPGYSMEVLNQAVKAHDELTSYLEPVVDERRKSPGTDLISALLLAEENGETLSAEDIIGNVILMLVAGHETTVNLIGNGMLALLKHSDQMELLKGKPELIESAVEECLRYDSPVQTVKRIVEDNMEYHGQKMKKGDMVILFLGACNRDPDAFSDANRFDITRTPNKHLSFSAGIHHCLGAFLARVEGQIALSTILKRIPDIRMAEQKLEYKHPYNLRGVKELHLVYSPQN